MRVAAVGPCNLDLIYLGLNDLPAEGQETFSKSFSIHMGGGLPATIINLARLGVSCKLGTFLGTDLFSHYVSEQLSAFPLEWKNLYHGQGIPLSVTSVAVTKRDRTFLSYRDAIVFSEAHLAQVYRFLKGSDIVLMSYGYLSVYRQLKAEGATLVLDLGWEEIQNAVDLAAYIETADYFLPNRAEAQFITGADSPDQAIRILQEQVQKPIVKIDSEGCLCSENGILSLVPPIANVRCIDATGAGDAFFSGFVYGICHGYPLRDCAALGNITGAACVQSVGALTGFVTEQELLAHFHSLTAARS